MTKHDNTSTSRDFPRIDEPERLLLHRRIDDVSITDDPVVLRARQRLVAFRPLLAEAEALRGDRTWTRLKPTFDDPRRTLSKREWFDLEKLLERHETLLDRTRKAAAEGGPAGVLDTTVVYQAHRSYVHELAVLLDADARLAFRQGATDRTGRNIVAMLQLAQILAEEPLFLAHVVSMSVTKRATDLLANNLPPVALDPAQEDRIIHEILKTVNRAALADCALGELNLIAHALQNATREIMDEMASTKRAKKSLVNTYIGPDGKDLRDKDAADCARVMIELKQVLRLPFLASLPEYSRLAEETLALPQERFFSRDVIDDIATVIVAYASHEARCALTATGLAVERYHAEWGEYPPLLYVLYASWDDIPGDIPTDPFTSDLLVYQPSDDSFLLYSVGLDDDDNDEARDPRPSDHDLVWRGNLRRA